MEVNDRVRREAIATSVAMQGSKTDDGVMIARATRVGRNENCPCGSGKKCKSEKSNERLTQQFACLERVRDGIEPEQDETGRNRRTGFLEIRELHPGFFIFRFPRER